MEGNNPEQMIARLLHLLKSEPDFQERLRQNFDTMIHVAGVPVSRDVTRRFLTGSSRDWPEETTFSPDNDDPSCVGTSDTGFHVSDKR